MTNFFFKLTFDMQDLDLHRSDIFGICVCCTPIGFMRTILHVILCCIYVQSNLNLKIAGTSGCHRR